MYRRFLLVLCVAAVSLAGCASDYRVVQTEQLDMLNQCAVAAEQNHQQLLQQQQQLAGRVDDALQQLAAQQTPPPSPPPQCPEVRYIASPQNNAPREPRDAAAKQLVGAVERVRFEAFGVTLPARIDTGIATAVLDARDIQAFERNSEEWVRFTIAPETGEPQQIERKLTRMASVPVANGDTKKRPVISTRFTLGQVSQQGEFILMDRSATDYPVLLGRLALRDVMIVDVSRESLAPVRDEQGDSQ